MPAPSLLSRLPRALRGLPWWAWAVALLVPTLAAAVLVWSPWKKPPQKAPVEDPRLTFATPFLNVRPDVRYVGDARCADCHAQGATYPDHPMGRSSAPAAAVADRGRYGPEAHNPFEALGFHYRVERDGPRVVHTATRRGPDGKELYGVAREVAVAVGSGTNGRSYLVNQDGYLYESPITWFPRAGRWDLSPGYAATTLFDRPVKPACVFCHGGDARPVPHSVNRYEQPLSAARPVGCERCHGPAELHLAARDAGPPAGRPDLTIVNPARLPPPLRDAVCEQCHLQGEARVLRRGREPFDFRPGLPLHLFWSVFVRPPELAEGLKFVGHAEQMRASVCAQKSGGELACISCHDPHRLPAATERVAYYRGRCQTCHEHRPCVRHELPPGDKFLAAHRDNDCVACHMPRRDDTEIRHASVSDHRIPRRPDAPTPPPARPQPGQMPLVLFHKDLDGGQGPEASRDLGLAVVETAQQQALPQKVRAAVGGLAEALLNEAVGRAPDDVAALEGRGLSLAMQGEPRRALADFEAALALAPGREVSLVAAADMAATLGQDQQAEDFWGRALEANPWRARYHARLAEVLARREKWAAALEECRAALRLNPAADVRRLLAACLLRTGDRAAAEAEFRVLLADHPGEEDSLRKWWEGQLR